MSNTSTQTGALPYRFRDGKPELLLITSRTRRRWIIPKGSLMDGKTLAEAAAIEAYEEAGVRGEVEQEAFAGYTHGITKTKDVQVHLLKVTDVLDDYPEAHQRQRQWFSFGDARRRVYETELKDLLGQIETHLARP